MNLNTLYLLILPFKFVKMEDAIINIRNQCFLNCWQLKPKQTYAVSGAHELRINSEPGNT